MTFEERFWSKINKEGPIYKRFKSRCWVWTAKGHRQGYGRIKYEGRLQLAHRVAYKLTGHDLPDDVKLLHHCDNTACCRPSHTFKGTQADNVRDMMEKRRHVARIGDQNGMRVHPESVQRGTKCRTAVLDDEKVRDIYWRSEWLKESRASIAREYKISETLVRLIHQRKAWAHVDLGANPYPF